jgi:hypothetical protein
MLIANGASTGRGARRERVVHPRARLGPLLAVVALAGCATDEEKQSAIQAVNAEFRRCYEQVLRERGNRRFPVSVERALEDAAVALESLGMTIRRVDTVTGTLRAQGPAPAPLTRDEWDRAVENDLPVMKRIVVNEVGLLGWFVGFEPSGVDVAITLTATPAGNGSDMSVTARLVERTPPRSGWPRREYPPCRAMEMATDKVWEAVARRM